MVRLLHLAPVGVRRNIERAGIHGAARSFVIGEQARPFERVVYAMPVLPDINDTFQWVREMRRCNREPVFAVYLRLDPRETVIVGHYRGPHDEVPLHDAVTRIRATPSGMEVAVPRPIAPREIVHITDLPQNLGWREMPGPKRWECVCAGCVAIGDPRFMRKMRGAVDAALVRERQAPDEAARVEAIRGLEVPYERAADRLDPASVLRFARDRSPLVRRSIARLMRRLPPAIVGEPLRNMLEDESGDVVAAAAGSLGRYPTDEVLFARIGSLSADAIESFAVIRFTTIAGLEGGAMRNERAKLEEMTGDARRVAQRVIALLDEDAQRGDGDDAVE